MAKFAEVLKTLSADAQAVADVSSKLEGHNAQDHELVRQRRCSSRRWQEDLRSRREEATVRPRSHVEVGSGSHHWRRSATSRPREVVARCERDRQAQEEACGHRSRLVRRSQSQSGQATRQEEEGVSLPSLTQVTNQKSRTTSGFFFALVSSSQTLTLGKFNRRGGSENTEGGRDSFKGERLELFLDDFTARSL
jgi:hypothetical protein